MSEAGDHHIYKDVPGEEDRGDAVTPPQEEHDRAKKRTQQRLEKSAKVTDKQESEERSKGFEGSSTREDIHGS